MHAPATARRTALTAAVRRQIAERAGAFVRQRYRMDEAAALELLAVPVVWRRGRGRSAFYPRACRGQDRPHIVLRVPPGAFARWHTYARVRARWTTPRGGLDLPIDVLMTTVLIHEYTHAVQHGLCGGAKRRYSEVETTENEIEYIRLHAPCAYAQLVHVPRPGRPRTAPRPIVERRVPGVGGSKVFRPQPSGLHAVALRLLRDIWVRCQVARAPASALRAAPRPAR